MREKSLCWGLLGLALLVMVQTTLDARSRVGRPYPGFAVMENLLVAVGGLDRGGLEPFDLIRTMNGRVLTSGHEIRAEAARHPPGTTFRYVLNRRGTLVEADVTSRVRTGEDFHRFLLEGFLPGLLFLVLGAVVLALKPGAPDTRLFLSFCLIWFAISGLYLDAHITYRFSAVFLTAWAFSPAIFIHLAAIFPERWGVARRHPWVVWIPYVISAVIAMLLQEILFRPALGRLAGSAAIGAVYWGAALVILILSLARTSLRGSTPLIRHRARVLAAGFTVGQLLPVLGTAVEAVARVSVPHLEDLWRLNILFPLSVAYAMVRYDLFDVRAVIRIGTIYAAVTGVVVLGYAGAITLVDLAFSNLGFGTSELVPSVIVALAVVLFLNPVYARTKAVVDRMFFRQRLDVQRSMEQLADVMTTLLDLHRIVQLITRTVDELLHPARHALFLSDDARKEYRRVAGDAAGSAPLPHDSPLPACAAEHRMPLTRERLREDPQLLAVRECCIQQMEELGAEVVVPVLFRERVTGLLTLGAKRSGAAYTTEDLRLLRLLVNQSAVALENAKAYTALQVAHTELQTALRRVEILESIRSSLSKFVPRTVQDLIEQAPEAPELAKREIDVSVLFVDIVGYTRLSERLDADRVNRLVERYFGAFLDEILRQGGDVNETAGDGLMVIYQDPDARRHPRAAVLTALGILECARQINAEPEQASEPVTLRLGVNSGVAAVGATKIEGTAGTRWTYTASGPVTNVAARLAGLGEVDAIVIGPETRNRLDREFAVEDLGEQRLKNVEEPVRAYRVASVTAAPSP